MEPETSSQSSRDARAAARIIEMQPSSTEVSPDPFTDQSSEKPQGQRPIDSITINTIQGMMNSLAQTLQEDMQDFRSEVIAMINRENQIRDSTFSNPNNRGHPALGISIY